MKRARREVETVEFVDPFLKRANRSSLSHKKHFEEGTWKRPERKKAKDEVSSFSRREIFKQVLELGASQFDKKDKKAYKKAQLASLGCSIKEKQKMPFKMYQNMNKRSKEKEAKKIEQEIESGVVTGRTNTPKKNSAARRKEEYKHKKKHMYGKTTSNHVIDVDSPSVGRFKNGILRIRKNEF